MIVLVIEGTYPWYRGGVSEWVSKYLQAFRDTDFTIMLREEQQRQQAELAARQYRNYLLGGGLLTVVMIAGILGWSWRRQKNKNQQIKEQAEQLDRQNKKLKEMDTFKSNMMQMIVHDLRNPLNVILGMADKNLLRRSAMHMRSLVDNILEVEKMEQAELEASIQSLDLSSVISNVTQQLDPIIKTNNQEIITDIDDESRVDGDEHLTFRTLENLVSNASKHSPRESTIKIRTEQQNGNIKVEVSDSGEGVAEENQQQVFNSYWTGNQQSIEGKDISFGLGLTFCKMAMEAQGGEVGVYNNEAGGATFWFLLPKT